MENLHTQNTVMYKEIMRLRVQLEIMRREAHKIAASCAVIAGDLDLLAQPARVTEQGTFDNLGV